METTAFALVLVVGFHLVLMEFEHDVVLGWRSGAVFGLAALIRPEGFGIGIVLWMTSWVLLDPEKRRCSRSGAMIFALLMISFEAFRLIYYGSWVPNTFFVKVNTEPHLMWGLRYLARAGIETPLWILATAIVLFGIRRSRAIVVGTFGIVSLVGWILWVGGDYLPFSRFLVPLIPTTAALAAGALARMEGMTGVFWLGTAVIWGLIPHWTNPSIEMPDRVVERGRIAARWIKAHLPADTLLATPAIGIVGANGGTRILDIYGLVDPEIAHSRDPEMSGGHPGHERGNPKVILDRCPDVILFGLNWVREIPMSTKALWANSTFLSPSERAILLSESFKENYIFFNTRVDEKRWLGMAVRKGSGAVTDHPSRE